MTRIKIFTAEFPSVLESKVNEFIEGKIIHTITYAVNDGEYSCCIVYGEVMVYDINEEGEPIYENRNL